MTPGSLGASTEDSASEYRSLWKAAIVPSTSFSLYEIALRGRRFVACHGKPESEVRARFKTVPRNGDRPVGVGMAKREPDRSRRSIVWQLAGEAVPACKCLARLPIGPLPAELIAVVVEVAADQVNGNRRR